MSKGLGRMQRRLLEELRVATRPQNTAALLPGRSGFEKRRALRKLAAGGLVCEVRPDTWSASHETAARNAKSRSLLRRIETD